MTPKKISAKKPRLKRAAGATRLARLPDPPTFIGFGGTAALDWGTALTDYLQSELVPTVGAQALRHFASVWLDAVSASSGALLDAAFTDIRLLTGRDALRIFKIRRRKMFLPMHLAWIKPMEFTPPEWRLGHGLDAEARIKRAQDGIDEKERSEGGAATMRVRSKRWVMPFQKRVLLFLLQKTRHHLMGPLQKNQKNLQRIRLNQWRQS